MKIRVFTILLAILPCLSYADDGPDAPEGTESGGGGSVIFRISQPILVDYLSIDPNFKDIDAYRGRSSSRIGKPSKTFAISQDNESNLRKRNAAFDLALHRIQAWKEQKFDYSAALIHIAFYAPNVWEFVDRNLLALAPALPIPIDPNQQVATAAYYSKINKSFRVQISLKIWNQLGILSQAGLLLHESLRHLQIGWSNGFDEASLQQATAILMMCQPRMNLNYYLLYLIQNRPDLAKSIYGDFKDVIKTYCAREF